MTQRIIFVCFQTREFEKHFRTFLKPELSTLTILNNLFCYFDSIMEA